jgi:hypothetical protein
MLFDLKLAPLCKDVVQDDQPGHPLQ